MISERIDQWAAELIQHGFQLGLLQRRIRDGTAQSLRRILQRRFGVLPPALEAQISTASLEQIELWFDRSIDAPNLGAIFAQH